MSHLISDSFDSYGSINDVAARWSAGGASATSSRLSTVASETPFAIGQSVGLKPFKQSLGINFPANATIVYGAFRFNPFKLAGRFFAVNLFDGPNNAGTVSLVFNGDGKLEARYGQTLGDAVDGTSLGSTLSAFPITGWTSVQFKIVVDATVGEVHVRLNGSPTDVLSLTGINTKNGNSNIFVNRLFFHNGQNYDLGDPSVFLDDVFFCSGDAIAPNTWLPDLRAVQQLPTNATQSQFTATGAPANWQAVAEAHADGDTSYVSAAAPGLEDRYGLSAVPPGSQILGINYIAVAKKMDAGSATLVVTLNGTDIVSNSAVATSYSPISVFRNTDSTGAALTEATANSAILGVKIGA